MPSQDYVLYYNRSNQGIKVENGICRLLLFLWIVIQAEPGEKNVKKMT